MSARLIYFEDSTHLGTVVGNAASELSVPIEGGGHVQRRRRRAVVGGGLRRQRRPRAAGAGGRGAGGGGPHCATAGAAGPVGAVTGERHLSSQTQDQVVLMRKKEEGWDSATPGVRERTIRS